MEVWEASENQEASPEWGVELVPPGKEEWAIRLQGSHRNQNLGVPLQESVEIYCAGEKIGRLDTGEKEGEVWKLVTLDQPGTAGSAFQIFIRGRRILAGRGKTVGWFCGMMVFSRRKPGKERKGRGAPFLFFCRPLSFFFFLWYNINSCRTCAAGCCAFSRFACKTTAVDVTP